MLLPSSPERRFLSARSPSSSPASPSPTTRPKVPTERVLRAPAAASQPAVVVALAVAVVAVPAVDAAAE